jgi:signal transduction histidine kinase
MDLSDFVIVLFFFPAIVSAGVALFAWQHRSSPGGKPLVIHGLGSAVWVLSYGAGTRLNSQLVVPGMLGVSWLAATVVTVSGMYVAAEYTRRAWLKRPLVLGSIGGYLCLEALMIGLNPGDLFYTRAPTIVRDGLPVYEFGVWWTVHLLVVFVAATAMLGMVFEVYLRERGTYRQQARIVLGGIVIIYLSAVVEVAGLEPYPDLLYNATMAGSTVLSITFLWVLFYADFLDVTPLGRKMLLEDIDDAAVVLDNRDRLVYANRAAQDLFGTGPEYAGMPADEFFDTDGNKLSEQLTGMANGKTEIAITADDENRYFSLSASTVGTNEQRRAFVLHETTAERTYRMRVEEQRDNLDTLNQVLRHDIRNDLTVIKLYIDLLDGECETEEQQQYINTIDESADHAVELTQTARELSDVMLSASAESEQIELQSILEHEVSEVRASYPGATLEFGTPVPSVTLPANEMVASVFRNLLKNAIQHNDKEAPEVTVSATEHAETVTVRIADNGPGIPNGQKETVFGEGEQGLDSAGTGIGLHLVSRIVDTHGGAVWVADNEPEGTVFAVNLPTA